MEQINNVTKKEDDFFDYFAKDDDVKSSLPESNTSADLSNKPTNSNGPVLVKSKPTSRLNISARGKGPKKSKMGLGAVKQKVDIEEAEQKAKEEEELINSLARSEEEIDTGSTVNQKIDGLLVLV